MYILDDNKLLTELLEDFNYLNIDTSNRVNAYIKYLDRQGLSKKEIANEVLDKLKKYAKRENITDWEKKIDNRVSKFTSPKFREFMTPYEINITYEELNFIKKFQDIETEKLLFTMLVLSKLRNRGRYENLIMFDSDLALFKLAKYKFRYKNGSQAEKRDMVISDLYQKGLVSYSKHALKQYLILNFGTNVKGDGLNFYVTNENKDWMIYRYLRWRGERIGECTECGALFEIRSKFTSVSKYCPICAKDKMKERNKINMRRVRRG